MTCKGDLQKVVDGGFCIGCGACAALDTGISIGFDDIGRLQARLPDGRAPSQIATQACPFSGAGPNEDTIASNLFNANEVVEDSRIGRHLACFAGWVVEGSVRENASSGGIATWLQRDMLERGLVDAVINVAPREGQADEPLFTFTVARNPDDVSAHTKTRYYPVEMSGVIRFMIDNPGRYATIGTPCFAKALRLAAEQSPELQDRLTYVLGIVCGHLKTTSFAEALAVQCEIDPDRIDAIDFRAKLKGRPASRYGVSVTGARADGSGNGTVTKPMEGLFGANWGHGLFKYKACEFCDDVLAETADVVVGDAWLPSYDGDHRGCNVVVVRHPELLKMLCAGRDAGLLYLDDLSADAVAESQAGGLRHRRDGLAFRLWQADQMQIWRPEKRVNSGRRHLAPAMRRMHAARYALGQASHAVWRDTPDFDTFAARMSPMIARYDRMMKPGLTARALGLLEHKIDTLLFRLGLRR